MGAVGPLLLLFSVAGGYTFLQFCHLTKHRWDALEWERNLFEASLVGALLFGAVRSVVPALERIPALSHARTVVHTAMPFPFIGSFVSALLLGLLVAQLINFRISPQRAIWRAVERHGGELLILLQHAGRNALPVSLTMDNNKVYVGFVMAPPTPKYRYTKIIPTVSGHRDPTTLKLSFDTQYWRVYEDLDKRRQRGEIVGVTKETFGIVLPIEHICSANLFDDDTFRRYFLEETNPEPNGTDTEART